MVQCFVVTLMVQCFVVTLEHTGTYYHSLQGLPGHAHSSISSHCVSSLTIPPLSGKHCHALREMESFTALPSSPFSLLQVASISDSKYCRVVRGHLMTK